MKYLIDPLLEMEEYNQILTALNNSSLPVAISGPSDSQKAHLVHALCEHTSKTGVYIAYNEMQARRAYEDFSFFLEDEVLYLPSKEIMMHDIEAKSYDAIYQRLRVMDRLLEGEYKLLVASAEAVSHRLVSAEYFKSSIIYLANGLRVDRDDLSSKLIEAGYERTDTVESIGQFAVRGGIIDVFPINSEFAARIELFDDEIDSIRKIDIHTQRSVDSIDSVKVIPAREVLYSKDRRNQIVRAIEKDLGAEKTTSGGTELQRKIKADIDRLENDYYFPGIDRYIPYIFEGNSSIIEYLAGEDIIFVDESVRFKQRIENLMLEHRETCKSMMEKAQLLPGSEDLLYDYDRLALLLKGLSTVYLNTIPSGNDISPGYRFSLPSKQISPVQGHIDLLTEDIESWKQRLYRVVILSGTRSRGERLIETLRESGIEAAYRQDFKVPLAAGQVIVTRGSLNKGFEYTSIGVVIVSDKEVFGRERKQRKTPVKNKGSKINIFTDLGQGDYVVHQAHGIGQYVGIESLMVEGIKKDYLKIRYQEGDFLYIPTNQMDLIQKYVGAESKLPRLNRLGGSEWAKTKSRVKESLRELAAELIKLYAQRQAEKGFAFSSDTVWQQQFEEMFPYDETDDQLKCIEEIKKDMESPRIMDRLLCGDVGYGKTEVAIRAIFKAVMDGKQVAYLVPTTILAQQHYNNFKERMKDFPVTVEMLSRFRSPAEQKRILKDVKAGNIDILVGTHRLIQKDIHFKDLGLLVVDEEQRFGVSHKERLKNFKPDVDVLTMTATPIPRTLHMSLVGIRDISVIEDPPEERYPVQTYVMEHNRDVIRDAITREMARQGQVFYLYNRVRSIEIKASEIQMLVPEARIAVAHGQMDERQLEDIMFSFINGEYDVLVCTTIIESGLDMPNVNTIIVEDADRMGLAQLYQLRGRVGRSNRLAYAYITYKKDKVISEIAEKRLQAIKEFTEFGSGFKIAMRDMEIRGAGNLLGPEQHGHMETVGYDMYCRLLDEAVKELRGEPVAAGETDVSIDINVNAYIDSEYINVENRKIEMYKRIAAIQNEQDVSDIQDELIDRYGDLPGPVRNLINISHIKALAAEVGFSSISEKNGAVTFQIGKTKQFDVRSIGPLMTKYRRQLLFNAGNSPYIMYKPLGSNREKLLDNIKIMLHDIKSFEV